MAATSKLCNGTSDVSVWDVEVGLNTWSVFDLSIESEFTGLVQIFPPK